MGLTNTVTMVTDPRVKNYHRICHIKDRSIVHHPTSTTTTVDRTTTTSATKGHTTTTRDHTTTITTIRDRILPSGKVLEVVGSGDLTTTTTTTTTIESSTIPTTNTTTKMIKTMVGKTSPQMKTKIKVLNGQKMLVTTFSN